MLLLAIPEVGLVDAVGGEYLVVFLSLFQEKTRLLKLLLQQRSHPEHLSLSFSMWLSLSFSMLMMLLLLLVLLLLLHVLLLLIRAYATANPIPRDHKPGTNIDSWEDFKNRLVGIYGGVLHVREMPLMDRCVCTCAGCKKTSPA